MGMSGKAWIRHVKVSYYQSCSICIWLKTVGMHPRCVTVWKFIIFYAITNMLQLSVSMKAATRLKEVYKLFLEKSGDCVPFPLKWCYSFEKKTCQGGPWLQQKRWNKGWKELFHSINRWIPREYPRKRRIFENKIQGANSTWFGEQWNSSSHFS